MVYKQKKQVQIEKTKETIQKIHEREHIYIEGTYQDKNSRLVVFCPEHGTENVTTFTNYKRSLTGCKCCGREQVSSKLINRVFSPETISRQVESAYSRPDRGGKPRRWREEGKYRSWRKKVLANGSYQCAITGKTKNLECHHLYGTTEHENLIYVPENGIVLEHELHIEFHKLYGYRFNTLEQFELFVQKLAENRNTTMLISSQAVDRVLDNLKERKNFL